MDERRDALRTGATLPLARREDIREGHSTRVQVAQHAVREAQRGGVGGARGAAQRATARVASGHRCDLRADVEERSAVLARDTHFS